MPADTRTSETDSITARLAERYVHPEPGTRHLRRFDELRAVLRNDTMRQNGAANAPTEKKDPTLASIFFLHGEEHRRRRAAIISFFRSDERRVGNEGDSPCESRWSPYH